MRKTFTIFMIQLRKVYVVVSAMGYTCYSSFFIWEAGKPKVFSQNYRYSFMIDCKNNDNKPASNFQNF